MGKAPRDLSDDELSARLRSDAEHVSPAHTVEDEAPVDLEDPGVELDQDGVRTD